jgi:hypothetical protein
MFYNSVASLQKLQIIILILKNQIFIPINVNTLASITTTKKHVTSINGTINE